MSDQNKMPPLLTAQDAKGLLDYYGAKRAFVPDPLVPFLLAVQNGETVCVPAGEEPVAWRPRGSSAYQWSAGKPTEMDLSVYREEGIEYAYAGPQQPPQGRTDAD